MADKSKYGVEALSKEVADQFDIIDWTGSHRQFFGRFGKIDLSTLTVAQAERLVKLRFSKIRRKTDKRSEPAAPAKK